VKIMNMMLTIITPWAMPITEPMCEKSVQDDLESEDDEENSEKRTHRGCSRLGVQQVYEDFRDVLHQEMCYEHRQYCDDDRHEFANEPIAESKSRESDDGKNYEQVHYHG